MKQTLKVMTFLSLVAAALVFVGCVSSQADSAKSDIPLAAITIENIDLLQHQTVSFYSKDVYSMDGVYFVDMAETIQVDSEKFKKDHTIQPGDVFLDANNRIVMFLGQNDYSQWIARGAKLGNIAEREMLIQKLESGNCKITFI